MQDNILIQFIKNHPALTISELSKLTNFSKTLLYGILSEDKKVQKALKPDKAFALAKALSHYGLRLNGWIFEPYDWNDTPEIIKCYRFKDVEQETIDKGDHFEYKVIIYRDIMDVFDFAQFIGVSF